MQNRNKLTKTLILLIAICLVAVFNFLNNKQDVVVNDNENVVETIKDYHFKNKDTLNDHYKKHGIDMGYLDASAYEQGAIKVILNPDALHKNEKEDNDDIYYLVQTNEIVFVTSQGVIRTYFKPDAGKQYFDKQ